MQQIQPPPRLLQQLAADGIIVQKVADIRQRRQAGVVPVLRVGAMIQNADRNKIVHEAQEDARESRRRQAGSAVGHGRDAAEIPQKGQHRLHPVRPTGRARRRYSSFARPFPLVHRPVVGIGRPSVHVRLLPGEDVGREQRIKGVQVPGPARWSRGSPSPWPPSNSRCPAARCRAACH